MRHKIKNDRFAEITTYFDSFHVVNPPTRTKKESYKVNPKTVAKMKRCIMLYERYNPDQMPVFVTITTCQHKNGMSDKECSQVVSDWLDLKKKTINLEYVRVCERQKETNDIHFHLILWVDKWFKIKNEVKYLNQKFQGTKASVFDIEKVEAVEYTRAYLLKYVTKEVKESEWPFYPLKMSYGLSKLERFYQMLYHKINYVEELDIVPPKENLLSQPTNYISVWKGIW
jgi:hypothetical protein